MKPPLSIIFSSYDSIHNPYYAGGGAIAIHEVAKRLARTATVKVLIGNYPGAAARTVDGVAYEPIGFARGGPFVSQILFHFFLIGRVVRETFDVWVESLTPPFSTSFLPLFTSKPVVALAHMLCGREMTRKYGLPFSSIENLGFTFYTHFIALTKEVAAEIKKYNPKAHVDVVGNGMSAPREVAHVSSAEGKYISFIGRIEVDQKGLDLLIPAYAGLPKKGRPSLAIAGSGSPREINKLKQLIAEYDIADDVLFLGRVSGRQKEEFFKRTLVGVVPSRSESFSMVALEMMSYGIPVVGFDIPGFSWIPKGGMRRVKSFDSAALKQGIADLVSNRADRLKLARKARHFALERTWDSVAASYRTFLEDVHMDSAFAGHANRDLIERVVKKRIPCFFVSPHLDDAVLSAGGLISYLKGRTRVEVINVFTEISEEPYTLSVREFMRQSGYKSARSLIVDRIAEDKAIFKRLGVRSHYLGFVDAIWRKIPNPSSLRRSLSRFLPEFIHNCPIYRIHVARGKISRHDVDLPASIAQQIKKIVAGHREYIIFCPSGLDCHCDHVIVREACLNFFPATVLWSDFPYNLRRGDTLMKQHEAARSGFEFHGHQSERAGLIALYKTQFKALFPEGLTLIPERYFLP